MNFDGNLSHAYIVCSPSSEALEKTALDLAAAMLCEGEKKPCCACRHCRKSMKGIHPDIITIERQKDSNGKLRREIVVEQIRFLVTDALILPNDADKKVYIIREADTMNASAQNAFLKLLEEPPKHVSFILCGENPGAFLETVRSRCTELTVRAEEKLPGNESMELAKTYVRIALSGNRAKLLKFCAEYEGIDKEKMPDLASAIRLVLTDILTGRRQNPQTDREKAMYLIGIADKTDAYIRANVGVKHIFGMLAVSLPELKTK